MRYKIIINGKTIAAFESESDRTVCLMAFEEAYEDCEFETLDSDD